ncbi:MAG: PD40 domain-containing protein [Saprospiraceae bacterium]|nr:PD40 domain-containing protein [Saprospiraceae bacterium]
MYRKTFVLLFLFLAIICTAQEARLLRFPATHSGKIAFTYSGNIYLVSTEGGLARRLTSHEGMEIFPRFSPDGSKISFTGQYDGNSEIYTMPSEGGTPSRVTFSATLGRDDVSDRMGPNNICMGWKDHQTVVFRSRWKDFNDWKGQLYTVDINGSMPEKLPLPHGGFCSFSPDKKKLAFNRTFREFRTWKRYRGGQADEIWVFDFESKQTAKITDSNAQDIFPMWHGDKIYFLSDRDSRMNLYEYDLKSKSTIKLTDFKEFDIKFPSLGDKAIVFENGGYIYLFDLKTKKLDRVNIQIKEDMSEGRNKWINAKDNIYSFDISPDGNRMVFSARGEIFTVPSKNGPTRNLTQSSGAHDRSVAWSPNGEFIAFVSDRSGEDEVYIQKSDGSEKMEQLTFQSKNYKYDPVWSPDGSKLMYSDRNQNLYIINVKEKKEKQIFQSDVFELRNYTWSPDSRFVCFTNPVRKGKTVVNIYSLEDQKMHTVTEPWFDSFSPEFSSDGKYLYFISRRTFNPSYNNLEWNHAYFDMAKPYLIPLNKSVKNPFAPKSDEVTITKEKELDERKEGESKLKEAPSGKTGLAAVKDSVLKSSSGVKNIQIDFDGIFDRVVEIPVNAGNYFSPMSVDDKLYYFRSSLKESPKLCVYDLKNQKETELAEKINGAVISADRKKMALHSQGKYYIVDLPNSKLSLDQSLNLDQMKVNLDKKEEWKQIYYECWRQMRDFFYDPKMHGVDWVLMRDRYASLLPYVNHRIDLTYIIGELIGELNCGHAYVGGGDYVKAERIQMGLLGADLVKDASGYFKIVKLYKSQNWDKSVRSPLTDLGVDAKEGEFITEINGFDLKNISNIFSLLVGKANQQVSLKLSSKADGSNARSVAVVPIADEQSLLYYSWVQNNIDKVNKATNGRVGYIHIPNMGSDGLNEFVKYFYAQLSKEGVILDDRGNGGGNVSPHIIERLRREPVQITRARNAAPVFEPTDQIVGPKVALIDEYSASDGDIFAYRFKKSKLGPVIGKRSWGGVVGIRGTLPIVDGGFLNRPEFARYDVDGKDWQIEGHGVDPDIVVDNDPYLQFSGEDQQLDAAIQYMLDQLKGKQFKETDPPPYPKK